MLDLTQVPEDFHAPAARVVETVLRASESLTARDVMIVGAWSRNILHRALGPPCRDPVAELRDVDVPAGVLDGALHFQPAHAPAAEIGFGQVAGQCFVAQAKAGGNPAQSLLGERNVVAGIRRRS